jgi:hypothetical protein
MHAANVEKLDKLKNLWYIESSYHFEVAMIFSDIALIPKQCPSMIAVAVKPFSSSAANYCLAPCNRPPQFA